MRVATIPRNVRPAQRHFVQVLALHGEVIFGWLPKKKNWRYHFATTKTWNAYALMVERFKDLLLIEPPPTHALAARICLAAL